MHGLGQGRVGVDGAGNIFGATLEFHGQDSLCYQFGGIRRQYMNAEYPVGVGIAQHFYHTLGIARRQRASAGCNGKDARIIFFAGFLQFVFGTADPG